MVRIVARYSAFFLMLSLLSAPVALAQANGTGSLRGTVTDQQGLVIPGAEVSAKNDGTGFEVRTIANKVGVWEISSLPGGSYTVRIGAQAFQTKKFIEKVDTGSTVTVDATLQIGLPVPETVRQLLESRPT
jgi:hypothetical protein